MNNNLDKVTVTFTKAHFDAAVAQEEKAWDYTSCCLVAQGVKDIIPDFKGVGHRLIISGRNHSDYWEADNLSISEKLADLIRAFDFHRDTVIPMLPLTVTFVKKSF